MECLHNYQDNICKTCGEVSNDEFIDEQISYEKTFLIGMKDDEIPNWNKDKQVGFVKGMEHAKDIIENW